MGGDSVFPAKVAHFAPYLKFYISLITVVLMSVTVPLGSPVWLPIVIAALNALAVFFTPNFEGRYGYTEEKPEDSETK